MADEPTVIVQTLRDGPVARQLGESRPPSVVVETFPANDLPTAGRVVMSVLSPESLRVDRSELDRALQVRGSAEPPVVVIEAADELREDELAAVVEAARHRGVDAVIVRVERSA
jgi:biopolymer transport protein ExbD